MFPLAVFALGVGVFAVFSAISYSWFALGVGFGRSVLSILSPYPTVGPS